MVLGRVVGKAVSTLKHRSLQATRLLVVEPIQAMSPDPVLAMDTLGARAGDIIVMSNDGKFAREMVNDRNSPARWWIMGIIDDPDEVEVSRRPAGSAAAAADLSFPLCGSCRSCQDACPVGALPEPGRLDEKRCLQALCTKTGPLSDRARRAWGYRCYGCQSSQEVCPHNRNLSLETETRLGSLGASISLKRLLSFSPAELKSFIRGTVLDRSWIPPRTLLRNALLAAGNRRDPVLLEAVIRHCSSPDSLAAQAAAWARERIVAVAGGQ